MCRFESLRPCGLTSSGKVEEMTIDENEDIGCPAMDTKKALEEAENWFLICHGWKPVRGEWWHPHLVGQQKPDELIEYEIGMTANREAALKIQKQWCQSEETGVRE